VSGNLGCPVSLTRIRAPPPSAPRDENHAARRRVISANAASPSVVNVYGECRSRPFFLTNCLRLRYCIKAFIDWRGRPSLFVTSMIRNSPESKMAESTCEYAGIRQAGGAPVQDSGIERIEDASSQRR